MNDLMLRVSACQAVHHSALKLIDNVETTVDDYTREWASEFVVERQCFGNALKLCMIDPDYKLVIGYVYFYEFNIAIEHAWNRNESGDLDLTAALYWSENEAKNKRYVELHTFDAKQAIEHFENAGGIDHATLRRDPKYKRYWNRYKVAIES